MIVFGSGGHTTEMLLMIKELDFNLYEKLYFVMGHSDTWSQTKIQDFFLKNRKINIKQDIKNIETIRLFRSREVKQSYFTSIFTTIIGMMHSVKTILITRPDMVTFLLSNLTIDHYQWTRNSSTLVLC